MNSSSVARSISHIQRVQERTMRRYPENPLTWGFQLDTDVIPGSEGELALRVTTLGGERLWLTDALLDALEDRFFYISGLTPAVLHPPAPTPGESLLKSHTEDSSMGPVATFPMLLFPGSREFDVEDIVGLSSTYEAGQLFPLICLMRRAPIEWPR